MRRHSITMKHKFYPPFHDIKSERHDASTQRFEINLSSNKWRRVLFKSPHNLPSALSVSWSQRRS